MKLQNVEINIAKLLIMNKQLFGIGMIIIILFGSIFRDKINLESFNLLTVLYYSFLLVFGIVFFLKFKPGNRSFWLWIVLYVLFVVGISVYFYNC